MSELLQIICPACSNKLRIKRPSAQKASVKCPQCGKSFTFNVPAAKPKPAAAAKPVPAAKPVAKSPAPAPASSPTDLFDFQDIPDSGPATAAASPAYLQAAPPPRKKKTKSKSSGSGGGLKVPLVVAGVTGAMIVMLGGGYFLATKFMPGAASIFDSADAIASTADARNREIVGSIKALDEKSDLNALKKRMEFLAEDVHQLVFRAALVSPISALEAEKLPSKDSVLKDRLGFEEQQEIDKHLDRMSDSDKAQFRALVSHAVARQSWVMEYLKKGHVELSEPATEGERIACERIEIIRRVNRLAAGLLKGHEFKEPLGEKSHKEIVGILNDLYSPILQEVDQAGDEMIALGERRYGLKKDEVGNMQQYAEPLEFERMMQGFVFLQMAFLSEKPQIHESVAKISRGSRDIDGAAFGRIPDGVREKKEAEDRAIAERAAKEAEQSRLAAEAERAEAAKQAANENQSKPPANSLAGNDNAANPFESPGMDRQPDPAMDAAQGGFPGSRFGPRGIPRGGPGRFGPGGFRGGSSQTDPSRGGQPGFNDRSTGPPTMDPKTSVKITMANAKGINSRNVSSAFGTLKVATSVRISNGKMEAKIGYAGDVQDVAELIQFGKVESVDKATRTIVVVPK